MFFNLKFVKKLLFTSVFITYETLAMHHVTFVYTNRRLIQEVMRRVQGKLCLILSHNTILTSKDDKMHYILQSIVDVFKY